MGILVVSGAQLLCSFGAAPCSLVVAPGHGVNSAQPVANVCDKDPGANIAGFGLCSSPANPAVASATAAALGVLTPQPCMPVTTARWTPGTPKVVVGGQMAVDNACQLTCAYGGMITVVSPGQAVAVAG
ncbi:DUF4280 domain-containing protein [Desulfoluna spongiiphila]|uniref:DUF4280 domain-containing protein n=1 Tax=Desulfoluna spongiiphila TaxID=419481 RepID=UPI00125C68F6|nr:DUF4280 domain-containing protein [Desulfoluna spongiiphila]VVS95569.1 protein of unknown function duf4280 [Desulfoluna spongiiphila]